MTTIWHWQERARPFDRATAFLGIISIVNFLFPLKTNLVQPPQKRPVDRAAAFLFYSSTFPQYNQHCNFSISTGNQPAWEDVGHCTSMHIVGKGMISGINQYHHHWQRQYCQSCQYKFQYSQYLWYDAPISTDHPWSTVFHSHDPKYVSYMNNSSS